MRLPRRSFLSLLVPLALSQSGCVGLTAQLLYVIKGDPQIPAEFEGLEGKRVAVVCVANTSSYDPNSASTQLAHAVSGLLRKKVKKINVLRPDQINNWIDNNNWNQVDFREVGKGVNAEMVVGIDLEGFVLHEDATLYKGWASATVRVFDITRRGEKVYSFSVPNFTFPSNGGQHVTDTTDRQFQARFVVELANHIARHFYAYDVKEDFGRDATLLQ